jgi:hypothetical protein
MHTWVNGTFGLLAMINFGQIWLVQEVEENSCG